VQDETLEERQQREYEREEIIKKAVGATDRIIMDGSDGSEAETDYVTARVAEKLMARAMHPFYRHMLSEDLKD
ncbi:unnamed protein product, partial [marine sediment metagenome]